MEGWGDLWELKSGPETLLRVRVKEFDAGTDRRAIMVIMQDVTETTHLRNQMHEQAVGLTKHNDGLRKMFYLMPVPSVLLRKDGTVIVGNEAFLRAFEAQGFQKEDYKEGEGGYSFLNLVDNWDGEPYAKLHNRVLHDHEPVRKEVRMHHRSERHAVDVSKLVRLVLMPNQVKHASEKKEDLSASVQEDLDENVPSSHPSSLVLCVCEFIEHKGLLHRPTSHIRESGSEL